MATTLPQPLPWLSELNPNFITNVIADRAIPEILAFADDSMALAKEALEALAQEQRKSAATPAPVKAEPITLTKVASADRINQVAKAVADSGIIPGSRQKIAKILEQSDPVGLLDMVEKLATTAVFPVFSLDEDLGPMVLSAKPTGNSVSVGQNRSLWAQEMAAYKAEKS